MQSFNGSILYNGVWMYSVHRATKIIDVVYKSHKFALINRSGKLKVKYYLHLLLISLPPALGSMPSYKRQRIERDIEETKYGTCFEICFLN